MRIAVVGSGIAGNAAAWTLSQRYHVTVYERDDLPDGPANRPAVPQGRHVHLLMARGAERKGRWRPARHTIVVTVN